MKLLLNILNEVPEFARLASNLEAGRSPVEVSGLSPVHRAHFAAGLLERLGVPVVLVCADEGECRRLAADVTALTGAPATLLCAREFLFHEGAVASRQWEHRRIAAFHAMAQGKAPLIAATVEGLLQRTLPRSELAAHVVEISVSGSYDPEELADRLAALGYTRCQQVEGVGQFALRGGILDGFSPGSTCPPSGAPGIWTVRSSSRWASFFRSRMKTGTGSGSATAASPPATPVFAPPRTTCPPRRWCA